MQVCRLLGAIGAAAAYDLHTQQYPDIPQSFFLAQTKMSWRSLLASQYNILIFLNTLIDEVANQAPQLTYTPDLIQKRGTD